MMRRLYHLIGGNDLDCQRLAWTSSGERSRCSAVARPALLTLCGCRCGSGSAAMQQVLAACIEAVAALTDIHGVRPKSHADTPGSHDDIPQVGESAQAAVPQVGTVPRMALLAPQSAPPVTLLQFS